MRLTRGRRFSGPWLQAAALLALLASVLAHAAEPDAALQSRDRALIDAAVAAMPEAAGELPALYVVGVAGDATEDVFRNEARFLVDQVAPRLGAGARALALVNHADALDAPGALLATPATLGHALATIGAHMRRDRDVLLLYLTMHGTPEHELWLQLPGGEDVITPAALRGALDAAGIVHRVVVVSACYSGGFVPALRGPDTLVLTAARRDRTSFGCATTRPSPSSAMPGCSTASTPIAILPGPIVWRRARSVSASAGSAIRARGRRSQPARASAARSRGGVRRCRRVSRGLHTRGRSRRIEATSGRRLHRYGSPQSRHAAGIASHPARQAPRPFAALHPGAGSRARGGPLARKQAPEWCASTPCLLRLPSPAHAAGGAEFKIDSCSDLCVQRSLESPRAASQPSPARDAHDPPASRRLPASHFEEPAACGFFVG